MSNFIIMKKLLLIFSIATLVINCGSSSKSNSSSVQLNEAKVVDPTEYASTITSAELKEMLYKYASDEFETYLLH